MNKIVLHACCAVCAAYSIKKLRDDNFEPIVYFYNPNIYPQEEYLRRLNELINYSKKENFELIYEKYCPEDFKTIASGYENEPEKGKRCEKCFLLRLNKTASKAKELGITKYTTTLTISPHKVSSQIFKAGEISSKNFGLEFIPYNFKKQNGFKITQQIARENNMYKQTYCGCMYSIKKEN